MFFFSRRLSLLLPALLMPPPLAFRRHMDIFSFTLERAALLPPP